MGTAARAFGAAVFVLVVGAVVWSAASIGVAQWTEDVCFGDLDDRPAHGSYRSEVELFPPSYVCRLRGRDVPDVTVEHPVVAWVAFGAIATPPVATVVASAVAAWGVVRIRRRRPPGPVTQPVGGPLGSDGHAGSPGERVG